MSLFNGDYRRGRVVNLGVSNAAISKSSILQKAQQQREKRRQFKRQENASKTLQRHIRSYLDLQENRRAIYDAWMSFVEALDDVNQIVYQFCFFEQYCYQNGEYLKRLECLDAKLCRCGYGKLKGGIYRLLFDTLGGSFRRCLAERSDAIFVVIVKLIHKLTLEDMLYNANVQVGLLLECISANFKHLMQIQQNQEIVAIVHRVKDIDPVSVLKLLSNDCLPVIFEDRKFGHIVTLVLETVVTCIANIKTAGLLLVEKLNLLANVTTMVNAAAQDQIGSISNGIVSILEVINCTVVEDTKATEEDVDILDSQDTINTNEQTTIIELPTITYHKLDYLYSKEFLYLVFLLIESNSMSPVKLPTIYSCLLKLKLDSSREANSLFVYLYLIPNGLSSFRELIFNNIDNVTDENSLNLVNNKTLFNSIVNLAESDAIKLNNVAFLQKFVPSEITNDSVLNKKFFSKDLYIFLEILSYWLVISTDKDIVDLPVINDISSSSSQFLTKNQFTTFVRFLKRFCLLLTWNNIKIGELLTEKDSEPQNVAVVNDTNTSSAFGSFLNNTSAFGSFGSFGGFTSDTSAFTSDIPAFNLSTSDDSPNITDTSSGETEDTSFTYHDFTLLKQLSFRVLGQINLIDSRLSIFPKGFWLVDDRRLEDTNRLLPVIAEEEERKAEVEEEEDNDDEMAETRKYKGSKAKIMMKNQDIEGLFNILNNAPFFISFKNRVRIFQMVINLDRQRGKYDVEQFNEFNFLTGMPQVLKNSAEIRREHLLDDSFAAFHKLGDSFKFPMSVTFIDKYGKPEAGIDGGGITKEFLTSVVKEGFDPHTGLFVANTNYQLYPNPNIYLNLKYNAEMPSSLKRAEVDKLQKLEFLGKVIGKCLYEGILVDVNFVPFFLKKWKSIGKLSTFDELNDVDPELYSGLSKLLKLNDDFFKSSDMSFTLTSKITYTIPSKTTVDLTADESVMSVDEQVEEKIVNIDLVHNGSNFPVTNFNKLNYINAVANFKLNKSIYPQIESFLKGLFQMIPSDWLNMFNPTELQMLVSGGEKDIDIQDFQQNVEYGGFLETDLTVRYFWECVNEMSPTERFKLIKFVTSVPRAPLLGFSDLNPKFGIRNAGSQTSRLPTASTCVNLLKLPDYKDKQLLKAKLLYVINSEAGFDLS